MSLNLIAMNIFTNVLKPIVAFLHYLTQMQGVFILLVLYQITCKEYINFIYIKREVLLQIAMRKLMLNITKSKSGKLHLAMD